MNRTTIGTMLLAAIVVAGMTVPVMALSGQPSTNDSGAAMAAQTQNETDTNGTSVNVTVGQQLSTVIDVSSDEVQTDFENTAFELSIETESEEAQAEAVADRAEEIRERAEDIREDYEGATAAYEAGEITRTQYAQRLATLNARASNLLESYEQLRQRSANVSALELQAAGLNQSALETSIEDLRSVNGTGAAALLEQFTGQSEGKIELETENGLSIEVESEDGERSREFERSRDDDDNVTVNQSAALETARSALSTPDNGSWVLTGSTVEHDDVSYAFEFALRNASGLTGEAEVAVDGSTGEIFELEEKIEPRDEHEDDEEDKREEEDEDDRESELAMVLVDGTPAPNETVTLQVLADGSPAENVTVYLNEQIAGTTDGNGTVTVTLPAAGEAKLSAAYGDAESELEFEFESDDDDEIRRNLNVDATLDNDTVSVAVEYDGSGVSNVTIYANDQQVGTTAEDGTVTFPIDPNGTDELELELLKGAFEADLTFAIDDGNLTLTEQEYETDSAEDERDEDDADEDEREDDDEEIEEGDEEDDTEAGSDEADDADDADDDAEDGDDEDDSDEVDDEDDSEDDAEE